MRGLGSENIDYRLRNADFASLSQRSVRWLGTSIASLSQLQRVLVVGSILRKDHPLFAQRIRQAARKGAQVHSINAAARRLADADGHAASPLAPSGWVQALADVAAAIAADKGVAAPLPGQASDAAKAIAASLLGGERKAILLGNAAAQHPQASQPAGAGQLDRRADRRDRRLPDRSGQHGRRATGRRLAGAGRAERRPDARRAGC